MITLISNDNININIDMYTASKSIILQDLEENMNIPINISSSQLLFIYKLCLSDDPLILIEHKTPIEQIDLAKDLNFMAFEDLTKICCKSIALNIKGCSSEEIRRRFTK